MHTRILLLDASESAAIMLERLRGLLSECLEIDSAATPGDAELYLRSSAYHLVLARFPLPACTPAELLEQVWNLDSLAPVVIHEPDGSLESAIALTKLGAFHYLSGEVRDEALARVILAAVEHRRSRELASLSEAVQDQPWRRMLVGSSQPMELLARIVRLVGPRRCTVLITGETGTGKEMVARAIHMAGNRSHLPLVAVNCSALPEDLLEAELFGHVKGAFTGALQTRVGRFEQANRGSLFLDEVGDMPLELQAKLLRVLQEREFQRLGSSETIQVDVRVIAATNVDLLGRVREGRFREDLYYRLNVVPIETPPLRERAGDIPALVSHFVQKVCRQEDLPLKQVAPETMVRLRSYPWPGNVRQLENAVEMAIALSGDRNKLFPGDFPLGRKEAAGLRPMPPRAALSVPDEGLDFEQTVESIERDLLTQALSKTRGNKKQAAEMLGLKRTTLTAKLKSLEKAG